MADQAPTTNVVRLPTAARRKVQNPRGLEYVAAVKNLPVHPATWEDHGGRKPTHEARFDRSPEMLILMAMFKLLPDGAKDEIRKRIATMADIGDFEAHAPTALHIVECVR